MTTRAAIYLRHSVDKTKTVNQMPEVEAIARTRGYEVVRVFEEAVSAAKHRPEYEAMLRSARRGQFDVVLVWAIDRFGRSMIGNVGDILELDRVGVQVVSVRESWLDTAGPVRALLIAIFSWVGEQERARLIERTRAGLASARRRGVSLGRPRADVDVRRLRELRDAGWSVRRIAQELKVGSSTVQRSLERARGAG